MYGLPPHFVEPGLTIGELLAVRKDNGTFAGEPEAYVAKLMSEIAQGETVNQLVELPDGRTISVSNHPMPEGGWVSTHEDITERRRGAIKIAHMARPDALTDLPNRVLVRGRFAEALAGVPRGDQLAALYLDLHNCKQ